MADLKYRRVSTGDLLQPHQINVIYDRLEQLDATPHPEPRAASVWGLAAVAAVASQTTRPISRRSILWPFAKKNA